jgi:hypothetical protein
MRLVLIKLVFFSLITVGHILFYQFFQLLNELIDVVDYFTTRIKRKKLIFNLNLYVCCRKLSSKFLELGDIFFRKAMRAGSNVATTPFTNIQDFFIKNKR